MAGKREENLMAKIAAMLNKDVEEIKEAKAVYTEQELAYEAQSVLNYFHWRKRLEQGIDPKTGEKYRDANGKIIPETDEQFERRQREWRYKECENCKGEFAYAYHYDGVGHCSLDCLKATLKTLGIEFHPGRPLEKRWGYSYPGIVPPNALASVESALQSAASASYDHAV